MLRLIGTIAISLLLLTAASAQQQPPSPREQALSSKLSDEINENVQVRALLMQAQSDKAALQKQVEELKAKYEPVKDGKPAKK